MYTIQTIDTHAISDQQLQALYQLETAMTERYGFLPRIANADDYRSSYLSTFAEGDELLLIQNSDQPHGVISFKASADWNGKARYELTLRLSVPTIRPALAEVLHSLLAEKTAQHPYIAVITYNAELTDLLKNYTAKTQLKANVYTLDKQAIDLPMLDALATQCQAQNENLTLTYVNGLPDQYLDQWCSLFAETGTDMADEREEAYVPYIITPEVQRKNQAKWATTNLAHHCCMIFDGEQMVAITNVSVNNNDPRFPYQFMVGVKADYRGRGLGKWLYAAMYQKLAQAVDFETLHVKHHPENTAAIAVSEWAGYQLGYQETTCLVEFSKKA